MAENVLKLKRRAVELGMDKADAMKADRAKLEDFIAEGGTKPAKAEAPAKVAKKKVVAKKKATKAPAKKASEIKPARKKATRSASKKSAPAEKSAKAGKAKRPTTKAKAESNGDFGRNPIGAIDWKATSDDWNPREGGSVERLFKALKKSKGDIDKAYEIVAPDVWDFVGKKMRDGSKRGVDSARTMLRYRLNRTKYDFAKRTGQHDSADPDNRAAYGTGVYATVRKAKAPRKSAATKSTKKTGTKRGRKTAKK